MSEVLEEQVTTENGVETPGENQGESTGEGTGETTESTGCTSIINQAVESVMDLIDALSLFSSIKRGALGTGNGLTCEIGPSTPQEVYLDKNQYIPVDLTINGKNTDLDILSDHMNLIHESLTMATAYPSGTEWKIVDITTITEPQVIGREDSNAWIMASSLAVKVYTMKGET